MSIRGLFYLIVSIFFFSFCSLKSDDEIVSERDIVGTWNWQESRGGFSGNEIVTPESTGVTIKLVFGGNEKVTVYTDNVETGTYVYTIKKGKSIFDHKEHYLLTFNEMTYVILYLDHEELCIQDNFTDGYVLIYTK
ncbi:hypothetical protein [Flavobacterium flavipallidum]|uniref:Lipocalin-like domain-containing protein n=1 Tax=Flavobacterium flavipallidum TaxID=3139140 RepID=A0ABU9HNB6_9FLAO